MNRLSPATVLAFLDEMQKIAMSDPNDRPSPEDMAAYLRKEAAFMTNVGIPIYSQAKNIAGEIGGGIAQSGRDLVQGVKNLPWYGALAPQAIAQGVPKIPGMVQGAVQHGIQDAGGAIQDFAHPLQNAKAGIQQHMGKLQNDTLLGSKYLSRGLAAYDAVKGVHEVVKKDDPTGMGRSRLHRALTSAGSVAGGLITGRRGFVGGLIGRGIGGKLGDIAGRTADTVRKFRPPEPSPDEQGYARPGF